MWGLLPGEPITGIFLLVEPITGGAYMWGEGGLYVGEGGLIQCMWGEGGYVWRGGLCGGRGAYNQNFTVWYIKVK